MDKKTTPVTISSMSAGTVELPASHDRHGRQTPLPSEATIAFIRQFARVYSYEPSLGGALGGLMAN